MKLSRRAAQTFPLFRLQMAVPLGLMGVLTLQGCSYVFSSPPPRGPEDLSPQQCTSARGLALADASLFGLTTTGALIDLAGNYTGEGKQRSDRAKADRNAFLLVDAAFAAVFLGSALYGYRDVKRCDAVEEADAISSTREHPQLPVSRPEATTPVIAPLAQVASAAPSGGAGFEFGESLQLASAHCTERQGEWSSGPEGAACSWVRDLNLVKVKLDFCPTEALSVGPESLCHIAMETTPQTEEARVWRNLVTSLGTQLRQRYGRTGQQETRYPEECKAPDRFYRCIVESQVAFRETWEWTDGHRVTLSLSAGDPGGHPSVRITFANAAYAANAGAAVTESPVR